MDLFGRIGAFIKSINFGDFFTQISHVVTIGVGLAAGLGFVDPHTAQVVEQTAGDIITHAQTVVDTVNQTVHAVGDLAAAAGTIGLLLHNSTPTNPS